MSTTTTVYADVKDNYIKSTHATWASAQAGTTKALQTVTNVSDYIGDYITSGTYKIYQCFMWFDTSAVGTDVISSATLNMMYATDGAREAEFDIECRAGGAADDIATTDWHTSFGTILCTLNTTGLTTNTRYDFTNAGTGLADAIVKDGKTRLYLISSLSRGAAPTTSTRDCYLYTGDKTAQSTYAPRLTIIHAPAPTGKPVHLFRHHTPQLLGGIHG